MLLLLGVIPHLSLVFLHATTTAVGTLLFTLLLWPFIMRYFSYLKKIPLLFLGIFLIFILHILVQNTFNGFSHLKAFISIGIAIYFVTVAYLTIWSIKEKVDTTILLKSINLLVYFLIFIAFFNIFTEYRLAIMLGRVKEVIPFGEASHFALYAGVFFIIFFIFSRNILYKIAILLVDVVLAILFPNTTMLIFAILMSLLLLKFNIKNIVVFVIALIVVFNIFQSDYFAERIDLSGDSDNLSALVYAQGVDYAKKSLVDTHGLGIGFQMMGTQETSAISRQIIYILSHSNFGQGLNRNDGGFLAAKIVTEFGILGIILLFAYIYLFIKSFFILRKVIRDRNYIDTKLALMYAIIFSFFVYVFVRGSGYFNPVVFLFLIALFYTFKFTAKEKSIKLANGFNKRKL